MGTVEPTCQISTTATPTSACSRNSLMRIPRQAPLPAPDLCLRLLEQADEPGCPLGVALEGDEHLFRGQAGLQRRRLEVGGDEREHVVVLADPGRRARPDVVRQSARALAADVLARLLAHLALGK